MAVVVVVVAVLVVAVVVSLAAVVVNPFLLLLLLLLFYYYYYVCYVINVLCIRGISSNNSTAVTVLLDDTLQKVVKSVSVNVVNEI